MPRKKVTGGLLQFLVPGLFIHTNTIEEFEALDLDSICEKEKSKISSEVKELANGTRVNM